MQRRVTLIAAGLAALGASAAAGGCSEDVTFPDGEPVDPVEASTVPAPGGIRRLLARQYINSVRLIFGEAAAAAALPPDDLALHGLASIGAADLAMPIAAVEAYDASAEAIGRAVAADASALAELYPCAAGEVELSCFEGFVAKAGRLAWRRELTSAEVDAIADLAADAAAEYAAANLSDPFVEGIQYAVSGLLTAPDFLYITELGDPAATDPTRRPLTAVELATRVSFFLTDTTPDEVLLDAAEAGDLSTDEGLRAMAASLVERPAAQAALSSFFDEAYALERLPSTTKDMTVDPSWDEGVAESMRASLHAFINDIVWEQNADVRRLMDADFTYVNSDVARYYDLQAGSASFTREDLPSDQPRLGLMGQAGMMALLSHSARPSPTKRGAFIRRVLQCGVVPPPPADVVPNLPEPDPDDPMTTKELLLSIHQAEPSCAVCHKLMDNVGLAYEQFDAVGRYREEDENGLTIDPSGEQEGLGAFSDAADVAALLAADPQVPACLAKTIFRNSMGHLETEGEQPSIDALLAAFAAAGYRTQDLLVEIVASPAFRLVGEPK
jgi:hypothetical protein